MSKLSKCLEICFQVFVQRHLTPDRNSQGSSSFWEACNLRADGHFEKGDTFGAKMPTTTALSTLLTLRVVICSRLPGADHTVWSTRVMWGNWIFSSRGGKWNMTYKPAIPPRELCSEHQPSKPSSTKQKINCPNHHHVGWNGPLRPAQTHQNQSSDTTLARHPTVKPTDHPRAATSPCLQRTASAPLRALTLSRPRRPKQPCHPGAATSPCLQRTASLCALTLSWRRWRTKHHAFGHLGDINTHNPNLPRPSHRRSVCAHKHTAETPIGTGTHQLPRPSHSRSVRSPSHASGAAVCRPREHRRLNGAPQAQPPHW